MRQLVQFFHSMGGRCSQRKPQTGVLCSAAVGTARAQAVGIGSAGIRSAEVHVVGRARRKIRTGDNDGLIHYIGVEMASFALYDNLHRFLMR